MSWNQNPSFENLNVFGWKEELLNDQANSFSRQSLHQNMLLVFSTPGWFTFHSILIVILHTNILSYPVISFLWCFILPYVVIYFHIISFQILPIAYSYYPLIWQAIQNVKTLLFPSNHIDMYDMIGGWTQQDGSSWGNARHHTKRSGH